MTKAMELMQVSVATVVETQWSLLLLLSVCAEADRGRWLTVADGDDGGDGRDGAGDGGDNAVATAAAVVCVFGLARLRTCTQRW